MFTKDFAKELLKSYYFISNSQKNPLINKPNTKYILEILLGADNGSTLGDKTANR